MQGTNTLNPQHVNFDRPNLSGPTKHNVFRQISVSSNKNYAWAVTQDYQLFQLVNTYRSTENDSLKGVWKKIETTVKVFDLSVGVDGSLYALNLSYQVLKWIPSKQDFQIIKSPEEMRQISVAHSGLLVTLDINSHLWLWNTSKLNNASEEWNMGWKKLSTQHTKYASISGDGKELWAIDIIDNTPKRFDFGDESWEDFDSPKLKDLSVSDNGKFVYGLSLDGHHILKLDTTSDVKNWKNGKGDTNIFNNISACDESTLGVIQTGNIFELRKRNAQPHLNQQKQQELSSNTEKSTEA